MKFNFLLPIICILFSLNKSIAQSKKAMTPEVYKIWNKLSNTQLSNNGKTVVYTTKCEECDPVLNIYNLIDDTTIKFERAKNIHLTSTGEFVLFERHAHRDTIRKWKLKKIEAKDMPKDSLVIFDVKDKSSYTIPAIESFTLPTDYTKILVYRPQAKKSESDTSTLNLMNDYIIIRNLLNKNEDTIQSVGNYYLSNYSETLIYEKLDSNKLVENVMIKNLVDDNLSILLKGYNELKSLQFSRYNNQYVLITSKDSSDNKAPELFLNYLDNENILKEISIENVPNVKQNWKIIDKKLAISEDGKRVFFEHQPPNLEQDSTLLPEDIVNVEVWSYNDPLLYTQQEVNLKKDKEKSYTVMIDTESEKLIKLSNPEYTNLNVNKKQHVNYALQVNDKPYQKYISWKGYSYKDLYLIDLASGLKKLIAKRVQGSPTLSPSSKYVFWFNRELGSYKLYDIEKEKIITFITNEKVAILNETNDVPQYPSSYGYAGWTKNDESFIFYDRYDIWEIDPKNTNNPIRLTNGRSSEKTYRLITLDNDATFINKSSGSLLMTVFDQNSMVESFAYLNSDNSIKMIESMGDVLINNPLKAKHANIMVFTKESYQDFPNLYISDSSFTNVIKITDINPQQADYNWGQIELFEWSNTSGEALKGLLVTPENFDKSKKYPLLINFYEKSSDRLNRHKAPFAHRSTINYTYYASKGYVIFNPDVTYNKGYPGQSCYEDVMSGINALLKKGFIDKERIGVQGHSWGGYQVAHLLTKTDIFACAESGAPVVNMISAYGGIRWRSGLSRMFQYERTQSRLGATLWERPDLYIENSPIFNIDKVKTPVLILHNDKDGAVPWYQGIEYFVALRRLGKPAWLLNYNDEPHWPVQKQNRFDFNIRMEQFFDHFLMDEKMPKWMKEGIAPIEKGINLKLD